MKNSALTRKMPRVGYAWLVPAVAVFLASAFPAMAAQSSIAGMICVIVLELTGPLGRAIACLAVITIGINAMVGRTSWSAALIVAVGISVVFSAVPLVVWLTGQATCPT